MEMLLYKLDLAGVKRVRLAFAYQDSVCVALHGITVPFSVNQG